MTHICSDSTYTPTLTEVNNIDTATATPCHYIRTGNIVTVAGKINFSLNSTGDFEIGISLPPAHPSKFVNDYECSGTVASAGHNEYPSHIQADVVNNRATMLGNDNDTSAHDHFFTFTYIIIP